MSSTLCDILLEKGKIWQNLLTLYFHSTEPRDPLLTERIALAAIAKYRSRKGGGGLDPRGGGFDTRMVIHPPQKF